LFAVEKQQNADVAQLIEQLICNHQVAGLSPIIGFTLNIVNTIVYKQKDKP
jgi:hypothetical protein